MLRGIETYNGNLFSCKSQSTLDFIILAGWINFVRLMIIVGLTGLLGTLVAQIIYWFKPHNSLKTTSLVFSTVTGRFTSVECFTRGRG
jgi:hypothetical protein